MEADPSCSDTPSGSSGLGAGMVAKGVGGTGGGLLVTGPVGGKHGSSLSLFHKDGQFFSLSDSVTSVGGGILTSTLADSGTVSGTGTSPAAPGVSNCCGNC